MNSSVGLSDPKIDALSKIYISTLSLSLIGSLSVIVVSIIRRKHLNEQVKPLLQLALADFLASAVLMSTTALNFMSVSYGIKVCETLLPLSLTFYCISFLLVIIYAFQSTHAAQGWREREEEGCEEQLRSTRRKFIVVYIFVWVLPLIGYVIYVETVSLTMGGLIPTCKANGGGENLWPTAKFCDSCLLFLHIRSDSCSSVEKGHDMFIRIFTLISVLSVLTTCTIVYCRLGSWYERYKQTYVFPVEGDGMSRKRLRGICSVSRCMVTIIILCWAPVLLLVSLSFTKIKQEDLFPLYVIQALFVSLHGFLNSIVYAWRRRNFRDAVLGEQLPLLARAFFDQSLSEPS
ncbi:uncharacterized protein si:dkey-30c15.2 [Chanos chanos]|uniref:Uncharacterized protein si:dkey-30c15.2 n=1 Tax=Chanos chanos TaxID=29144 RepID=A0A6J2WLV8_CHACN|nr:uncharacterized protein LOC115825944 [Chanos chanos]